MTGRKFGTKLDIFVLPHTDKSKKQDVSKMQSWIILIKLNLKDSCLSKFKKILTKINKVIFADI